MIVLRHVHHHELKDFRFIHVELFPILASALLRYSSQLIQGFMGDVLQELFHGHVVLDYVGEELLGMRSRLSACPSCHILFYFFPVLSIVFQSFEESHVLHHRPAAIFLPITSRIRAYALFTNLTLFGSLSIFP
jgi:hypothetical protein